MQSSCRWRSFAGDQVGVWASWVRDRYLTFMTLHSACCHTNRVQLVMLQMHNSRTPTFKKNNKKPEAVRAAPSLGQELTKARRASSLRVIWKSNWDGSTWSDAAMGLCFFYMLKTERKCLGVFLVRWRRLHTHTSEHANMRAAVGSHWLWWHSTHIQQSKIMHMCIKLSKGKQEKEPKAQKWVQKQEQTNDDIKSVVVEISAWERVRGGAQHGDLEAFSLI